jgi:hypothetical protein
MCRWICGVGIAAALVLASPAGPDAAAPVLALESPDVALVQAFDWARRQASAYVFEGGPLGDWYEAALPGREAFCMRDTSHQAMGAHALGLAKQNLNMLRAFARNATAERDWCSLWEIDRHGRPAHADYRNDGDFWYNLPANFDVLDTCYRMFLWTGDRAYVDDAAFLAFYERSVTDYVERWALGVDRVMKRPRLMNAKAGDPDAKFAAARGIPGYDEEADDFVAGLDLLAAEQAGFHAYGRILEARGDVDGARRMLKRASEVRALVNREWWDERTRTFFERVTTDGRMIARGERPWPAELYWPVADEGPHARGALKWLLAQIQRRSASVEEQSHHAEVLYRYGEADVAYRQMLDLARPDRERREYPEVSFSIVGAIVTGLMGVRVDPVAVGAEAELLPYFEGEFVTTLPQLVSTTSWAALRHLPVRANRISVRHDGTRATSFTNESGPAIVWRAALPVAVDALLVNGRPAKAARLKLPGDRQASSVRVVVAPGTTARVETPARAASLR